MSDQFQTLALKPELVKNLADLKFTRMTPVQEKALPYILEGHNVLAQAKTGSGKTAAFALGCLNELDVSNLAPQSLILCPTRELAEQVAKETRTLARQMKNVRVLTLVGAVAQYHQEKSLEHGAHIIVGTPGRVLRLLKSDLINTSQIKNFVLDEADKMLDMGFNNDIIEIVSFLTNRKQTMLFSATFPDSIKHLAKSVQENPKEIKIDNETDPADIKQVFYEVSRHQDKNAALLKALGELQPERFIVFCKTKQITDDVAKFLNKSGVVAAAIHGDLEQNERTAVLTKFSNRSLCALVATDVAARGLDIQELEAVINYDLPSDPEVYVHRIGRTGRAGKTGEALSFFIKKNSFKLDAIEEFTGKEVHIKDFSGEETLPYQMEPPMKTMYIGGGKKNKLRPGDVLGALVGEAGLEADAVGDINILNIITLVAVKKECLSQAIQKLQVGKIKNRKFKVGQA
ncbi:MAG: ATP-dependent RNA helicase DbpA [Bacteriovoracaceae bacterium]